MKRSMVLALGAFLCAAGHGSNAFAQAAEAGAPSGDARQYRFFVSGDINGAVAPSAFTDYYVLGFGLTAGMEFPVSPAWAIIGSMGYKSFTPDEGMIAEWWDDEDEHPGSTNVRVSEGTLQAFTIAVLGKGSLKSETSTVFPYVKGGFGLTIGGADEIRIDYDQFGGSQTEWAGGADTGTNFSVQFAVGIEFLLGTGTTSLFADVGVAMVSVDELDNPTVVPVNVGLKF